MTAVFEAQSGGREVEVSEIIPPGPYRDRPYRDVYETNHVDYHARRQAWTPVRGAFQALHVAYVVAPLVAGIDKFFNLLTQWTDYLAPAIANNLPVTPQRFMEGVGVVEIAAGILTAVAPRIGGYVVGAWLLGIVINFAIGGVYWDIMLRDIGLMLGAFALGRLGDAMHRYGEEV